MVKKTSKSAPKTPLPAAVPPPKAAPQPRVEKEYEEPETTITVEEIRKKVAAKCHNPFDIREQESALAQVLAEEGLNYEDWLAAVKKRK